MGNRICVTLVRQPGQASGCYIGPLIESTRAISKGGIAGFKLQCLTSPRAVLPRFTTGRLANAGLRHRRLRCGCGRIAFGYLESPVRRSTPRLAISIDWPAPASR